MKKYLLLLALLTLPVTAIATVDAPVPGTFALQAGTPRVAAYLLATQIGRNSLDRHLDTWMTPNGSSTVIRSYRVDMTKYLHMIAVSDDFRTFLHIHPVLGRDGHFLLDQLFPSPDRYHIYVDAHPESFGQQVFRFDVDFGRGSGPVTRDVSETSTVSSAGPYTVSISSSSLLAQRESHIVVRILKDGRPATDLHPYLGALAHAVFINANDLSYVHVHPMPWPASNAAAVTDTMKSETVMQSPPLPSSMTSSPNMLLHVALREPGTYKLWLQFRGGNNLYVAPFVLRAR